MELPTEFLRRSSVQSTMSAPTQQPAAKLCTPAQHPVFWVPLLAGVIAFLIAASRINHGLIDTSLPDGPGLTSDEPLYVSLGIYLYESLLDHGPSFFTPTAAQQVFGTDAYLPDHPPLGRMVLGASHQLTSPFFNPQSDGPFINIAAARIGSCFLLSLTVLIVCRFTWKQFGGMSAIMTVLLLLVMPRVIGHARLATLEIVTMLTWTAALLPLLKWWSADSPPTLRQACFSGLLFGLLLLTKMQAVFLPPLLLGWSMWRFRTKAITPLIVWGLTGLTLFFIGWPWLWLDPWNNTLEYFARSTERPTLFVWYMGQRFADKAVPPTYPMVTTLLTIPLALPLLITWRFVGSRLAVTRVELLLAMSVLWPLLVFSLPGTPVYDGTRLFLMVMPAVAMLGGRALAALVTPVFSKQLYPDEKFTSARRTVILQSAIMLCVIASIGHSGWQCGAFSLDSYNVAGRLVQRQNPDSPLLEAGYWSDSLNSSFWKHVPEGSTVLVAPVSHQFQLRDMQMWIPIVRERRIQLQAFEYNTATQKGLLLLHHRLADLRPALRQPPDDAEVLIEVTHQGTTLARLIDTSGITGGEVPDWASSR